jgi:hypothetical protein
MFLKYELGVITVAVQILCPSFLGLTLMIKFKLNYQIIRIFIHKST